MKGRCPSELNTATVRIDIRDYTRLCAISRRLGGISIAAALRFEFASLDALASLKRLSGSQR